MIELTTGVVFLMSSLYGPGHATDQMNGTIAANTDASQAATAQTSSFKDSKTIEALVRVEFADAPILIDVARCESTFRQYTTDGTVVRGRVDRDDIGIMQINERYQGSTAKKLGFDIYTVEGNLAYAKHLYQEQGTQPWSSSAPCWSKPAQLASKAN